MSFTDGFALVRQLACKNVVKWSDYLGNLRLIKRLKTFIFMYFKVQVEPIEFAKCAAIFFERG